MTFDSFLCYVVVLFCLGLGVVVFLRDRRHAIHLIFSMGMVLLAAETALNYLSFHANSVQKVVLYQLLRMGVTSLSSGIWFLFSLAFARLNLRKTLQQWYWAATVIVFIFIPLFLVTALKESIFSDMLLYEAPGHWWLGLGRAGFAYYIVFIILSVVILMNLEKTFRSSTGGIRWRIKFIILGVGLLFGFRIYSSSQNLLFNSLAPSFETFNSGAVIIACILLTIGLKRLRLLRLDIYVSEKVLYNSMMLIVIGIYLFVVGALAKVVAFFNTSSNLPVEALFVFIALLGVTLIFISDEVRHRIRGFVYRNFHRPRYDYRKEWREFTKRTTLLIDVNEYSSVAAKMMAEVFGVSSVTIWLFGDKSDRFVIGGSTALVEEQKSLFKAEDIRVKEIVDAARKQQGSIDVKRISTDGNIGTKDDLPDFFKEAKVRYVVPLVAGEEFLGIITLNDRITAGEFNTEDFDLIKTIADQTAGNLLNLKLSKHLQEIRQMEALQTMSAFMMHDLKNLASTISLTVQNLPIHFDNPEFRNDVFKIMEQSVNKINNLCSNLSMIGQKIELKRIETDLNVLIDDSLSSMNGFLKVSLVKNFHSLSKIIIDPEQIQKVITNLILNANEAVGIGGEIQVTTNQRDIWAILSVSDNGCGMSKEFVEQSLYHPFKTTKKQGMGIGLFHCKKIVEAHGGRIEVESEEGKGTTFKVLLPITGR